MTRGSPWGLALVITRSSRWGIPTRRYPRGVRQPRARAEQMEWRDGSIAPSQRGRAMPGSSASPWDRGRWRRRGCQKSGLVPADPGERCQEAAFSHDGKGFSSVCAKSLPTLAALRASQASWKPPSPLRGDDLCGFQEFQGMADGNCWQSRWRRTGTGGGRSPAAGGLGVEAAVGGVGVFCRRGAQSGKGQLVFPGRRNAAAHRIARTAVVQVVSVAPAAVGGVAEVGEAGGTGRTASGADGGGGDGGQMLSRC